MLGEEALLGNETKLTPKEMVPGAAGEVGREGEERQRGPWRSRGQLELSLELAAGPTTPTPLPLLLADTEVLGDPFAALLAPHSTAPVELAVTAGHHLSPPLLHC